MADKRVVIMDMDGVLADFVAGLAATVNTLWPGRAAPGYQPPDWGFTDILSQAEMGQAFGACLQQPWFWQDLAPLPGVEDLRWWLAGYSDSLYYVTQRPDTVGPATALEQTSRWLQRRGLLRTNTGVLVVGKMVDKPAVMRAVRATHAIDDKPENVEAAATVLPPGGAVLLSQSWNQAHTGLPRVSSLASWLKTL